MGLKKTLEIRTSPHILSGYSVDTIMFNVVLALLPVTLFAVYAFGLAGLLTLQRVGDVQFDRTPYRSLILPLAREATG